MRGLSVPVRAPFPHGHLPEPRPLPSPQCEAVQRECVHRPGLPDRRLGHPERQRVVTAPEFEFSEDEDGKVAPGGFRLVPVRLGAGDFRERAVVQGELEVRGRRLGVRYLDRGGGDGGQRVHAGLRGVYDVCRVPARPRGLLGGGQGQVSASGRAAVPYDRDIGPCRRLALDREHRGGPRSALCPCRVQPRRRHRGRQEARLHRRTPVEAHRSRTHGRGCGPPPAGGGPYPDKGLGAGPQGMPVNASCT